MINGELISIVGSELPWKITLGHDSSAKQFTLAINGVSFFQLEFQQELAPSGPQNVDKGQIKINKTVINPDN